MIINEFTAKKLGEVLAFARISTDTIIKGKEALVLALGEERIIDIQEKNHMHEQEILRIAEEGGCKDTTQMKAITTAEKLTAMRDMYVKGAWDNATELLEWSGFFEGAAIVHWALVRGCGEGVNEESLLLLAQEALDNHHELIDIVEGELGTIGADRAIA